MIDVYFRTNISCDNIGLDTENLSANKWGDSKIIILVNVIFVYKVQCYIYFYNRIV